MSSSESRLHEFNLLLSNATAAAKMASQSWPQPQTPQIQAWRERAQTWAAELEQSKERVALDLSWSQSHGAYGRHHKVELDQHPLPSIASALPLLEAAAGSLPPEAIEWAATEVAKHLAVGFERDGVKFLAFPHQGNGLKSRVRKGVPELSSWVSNWREKTKFTLPQTPLFSNETDRYLRAAPIGEEAAAAEAIGQDYQRASWSALQGHGLMTLGDLPTAGVHAGGTLSGSASSEEAMPRLGVGSLKLEQKEIFSFAFAEDAVSASANRYGAAADVGTSVEAARLATARRMGWLSVALLLGDNPGAAQAGAPWGAPACSAELALGLEAGEKMPSRSLNLMRQAAYNKARPPALGVFPKDRARRPAISAMQWAASMAVVEGRVAKSQGSLTRASMAPYSASEQQLEAMGRQGLKTAKAIDQATGLIMARAYKLAEAFQNKWLQEQGLSQAIEDLTLLSPGRPVSTKAVNWALAHPEAAQAIRQGQADPQLGFAARSSRYTGALADADSAAFIERSRQAWAAKGLGPEGFEGVSASAECQNLLSNLSQMELEERKSKPMRAHRQAVVELAARALQAAFAEGATPQQAEKFARWCSGTKVQYFLRDPSHGSVGPGSLDLFHPDMPAELIGEENHAARFASQARARRDAHPAAMRGLYRAHALGEGAPQAALESGAASDFEKEAAQALNLATRGFNHAPPMDWSGDLSRVTLKQLALRVSAPTARALEEAAASGVHGAFAARVAAGLGLFDARDGNDLTAQARDALRERHGLGASGWKALAKAPPAMLDKLAQGFEAQAPHMLQARAQALQLQKQAKAGSAKTTGLALSLLSWSSQFGLDLQDAADIAQMSIDRRGQASELLMHGARPITVSSADSAEFALNEIGAKNKRMPKIVQTMAERLGKLRQQAQLQGAGESSARAQALDALRAEVSLIDDWLRDSEDGVWQTLPPKATFADLTRRQAVWHEDVAARTSSGAGPKSKGWGSPMARHVQDGWSLELLANADALLEEGREMHHCVSSYSSYCAKGQSRIFSVCLNGERVSTVEMRLQSAQRENKNYDHQHPKLGDVWKVMQNLGKCNRAVTDPSALAFCASAVQAMNDAHAQWVKDLEAKRSAAAKAGAAKQKTISGL
jgi:hypothetical protein